MAREKIAVRMNQPSYYYDRSEISQLPETIRRAMKERGLFAEEEKTVHYCGVISCEDTVAVFLPRNSKGPEEEDGYFLLKALQRYYQGRDRASGVLEGSEDELIGTESLTLMLEIAGDYLTNGLYVRRKKRRTINRGKTDWRRTIARHSPFPSAQSPVYLDLETSRNQYVSDCETSRIHATIIRQIKSQYGTLIFGQRLAPDSRLDMLPAPSGDTDSQLVHLDRELSGTFSERDIRLIRLLKKYLERKRATGSSDLLIGTRKFHNVWEGMIDSCLPGKRAINKKLPVPYYLTGSFYEELPRKGQRTDTVIVDDEKSWWAVVDAKYYGATSAGNAPGWHDIVKQLFYEKAVAGLTEVKDARVSLHFIFPGRKGSLTEAVIGERNQGRVEESQIARAREGSEEESKEYSPIYCHYCEPLNLVRYYCENKTLDLDNKGHISVSPFEDRL